MTTLYVIEYKARDPKDSRKGFLKDSDNKVIFYDHLPTVSAKVAELSRAPGYSPFKLRFQPMSRGRKMTDKRISTVQPTEYEPW